MRQRGVPGAVSSGGQYGGANHQQHSIADTAMHMATGTDIRASPSLHSCCDAATVLALAFTCIS